jgi:hypothetical protein
VDNSLNDPDYCGDRFKRSRRDDGLVVAHRSSGAMPEHWPSVRRLIGVEVPAAALETDERLGILLDAAIRLIDDPDDTAALLEQRRILVAEMDAAEGHTDPREIG